MLTIVLAGLLAVLGAVAVLAYTKQANNRAVDGVKAVKVLAAAAPIPGGTSLGAAQTQKLLMTETVPANSVAGQPTVPSVNSTNEKLVVSATVGQGQVLFADMLVPASKRVASTVNFPTNKVAVTIALCIPESVAGYVTAGSRVAVFDTYVTLQNNRTVLQRSCSVGHQAAPTGIVHTQLVLSELEVLSVGVPSVSGQSLSGAISQVQALSENSSVTSQGAVLVTLAVDPTVAWKLIQAAEVGLPYLALIAPTATPNFGPAGAAPTLFGP
jgi:pilus assembly protein CpaB